MMAKSHTNKSHTNKKHKQVDNDNNTDNSPSDKKHAKRDTQPFMIHWKDAATGVKYKVGDKKEYGEEIFPFM